MEVSKGLLLLPDRLLAHCQMLQGVAGGAQACRLWGLLAPVYPPARQDRAAGPSCSSTHTVSLLLMSAAPCLTCLRCCCCCCWCFGCGGGVVPCSDVVTAPSSISAKAAQQLLRENKKGRLPLVNNKGQLVSRHCRSLLSGTATAAAACSQQQPLLCSIAQRL